MPIALKSTPGVAPDNALSKSKAKRPLSLECTKHVWGNTTDRHDEISHYRVPILSPLRLCPGHLYPAGILPKVLSKISPGEGRVVKAKAAWIHRGWKVYSQVVEDVLFTSFDNPDFSEIVSEVRNFLLDEATVYHIACHLSKEYPPVPRVHFFYVALYVMDIQYPRHSSDAVSQWLHDLLSPTFSGENKYFWQTMSHCALASRIDELRRARKKHGAAS